MMIGSGLVALVAGANVVSAQAPVQPGASAASKPDGEERLDRAFASPPQRARPRIRYWTPQAAVTEAALARDVALFDALGFGGIEVVSMPFPTPPDYAWGGARWNGIVGMLAREATRNDMAISFTNGPMWPIAMPSIASADDPGALYELTYGTRMVEPGERYEGAVPKGRVVHKEGTPRLAALLAYRMIDERTLDERSVVNLTEAVRRLDGTIAFAPPEPTARWIMLAFWEQPSAQKTNGSYVIDHFAKAGAQASISYWDGVLNLQNGPKLRVSEIFNDSLEYKVSMEWTRGLRDVFRAQHGYDLTPFLPFVGVANTYPANDVPGFVTNDVRLARKVNEDYLDTLTRLYVDNHLTPLQAMAQRNGATLRYQVGYNKPLDVETSALAVDVPETEALGRNTIDGLRQMAGAVHLGGKPFYSFESAAEFGNDYGQSLGDILWWNKRAWAAGVNIQTLHGASYEGRFDGPGNVDGFLRDLKWPGYSAFAGVVSNNWSRQTSNTAMRRTMDYMARVNYLMQKSARVDVAIYRHALDPFVDPAAPHGDGEAIYPDGGLLTALGYSYDFLTPTLLALPLANVRGGVMAAAGPAYRALIVPNQPAMSLATLQRLREFVLRGLSIVFVGATPRTGLSHAAELRGESDRAVQAASAALLRQSNVVWVETTDQVPSALARLGIRADGQEIGGKGIATQHRVDGSGDYYYLYNYNRVSAKDAGAVTPASPERTSYPLIDKAKAFENRVVRVSLKGSGEPYLLDAWTGRITPVAAYERRNDRVDLTLSFTGDQALLVGLIREEAARAMGLPVAGSHAGATTVANDAVSVTDGLLTLRATGNGTITTPLPGAPASVIIARDVPAAVTVADWTLKVDAIGPGATPSFYDSAHRVFGPFTLGQRLRPWRAIDPSLATVSGVGTYTGSFELPARVVSGALIRLGDREDAAVVSINGITVPDLDPLAQVVDVGKYVRSGRNVLTITTTSTLYNAVRGSQKDYGLLGTGGVVTIQPYRNYTIARP